jgi:ribosomal protein S18 acetylase RimI-like enzyme
LSDPADLVVRQATLADADAVSAILQEASEWLVERGTPMWRENEVHSDAIRADIEAGLFFLGTLAGEAAGTLKFQLSDLLFWPDAGDDSAYVHRLAVRRCFAGRGLSQRLLAWAADRAAAHGRPYLRLDCDAERRRLRDLYERFGFRHHSNRQVGPYFVARYEFAIPSAPEVGPT